MDSGYCTFQSQSIPESAKRDQNNLRKAIRDRNIDLVRNLISCGTEANGYPMSIPYERPLHLAVVSRSQEIVEILLEGGASIDLKSQDGNTPLTLAAKLGNIPVIDLLLSHTLKNSGDYYNLSHLHIACSRNNVNAVRKLLLGTQGQDINKAVTKDSLCWPGYTPLHFAVQYGCLNTVELLLTCGADITTKDVRQMTPLHLAHLHRNEEIIDLILSEHKYKHTNPTDAHGFSHFHIACTRDNPSAAEHFLKSGVNANLRVESLYWKGWRPIDFALYYECPNAIEVLLKFNVNLCSPDFPELLQCVFGMENKMMYNLFTSRKISFELKRPDFDVMTVLYQACIQDNTEKIEELLSHGRICALSDFNVPICNGSTPLHLAVRCNSANVTKHLLDYGADPMIQDGDGRTSLHLAFEYKHDNIFNSISDILNDFSRNLEDNSGMSIFHILCSTNNLQAIENLISKGIDVNAQVSNNSVYWAGFTPMHFALKFRQDGVVTILLKHKADFFIRNCMNLSPVDLLLENLDDYFYDAGIERKISEILITIWSSLHDNIKESTCKVISPLHAFCMNGAIDLTEFRNYLGLHQSEINKRIDLPGSPRAHKCTALHISMQRHHFEQAKLLLENGADPLLVNNKGETPLESAASEFALCGENHEVGSLFSLRTPIKDFRPSHFHLACSLGLTNVVKHVLTEATDQNLKTRFMNSLNDYGQTPLLSLLADNETCNEIPKIEITHLLLENGADVNARDFMLRTSLHYTEYPADFEVARTLLSYGADVNAQNVYGQTPLRAVFHASSVRNVNNERLITLLLENGADINIVDVERRTCMMPGFRQQRNDQFKYSVITLLRHVKKLEVIGFSIKDVNKRAYAGYLEEFHRSFDEREFIDQCTKEYQLMMGVKIYGLTSLYDLLFTSSHQMAFHHNNVFLQTIVSSSEFDNRFPIYGFLIRQQIKNGKIRESLLRSSEKFFRIVSERSIPSICLEGISRYLSNSDLKNVILSIRESNERDGKLEY